MIVDRCIVGDCREVMRDLIAQGVKVQTIVTSPPYHGLRCYGVDGQVGLEPTINEHLTVLVEVFRLARELLSDDGTLWLNYGDRYDDGKQLCGLPWRLAFALQSDGWILRQDIIWRKPNPMPESVRDRCTKAHEYLFLLAKQERYYFDFEAFQEPVNGGAHARGPGNRTHKGETAYLDGDEHHRTKSGLVAYAERQSEKKIKTPDGWDTSKGHGGHGSFHKNGREKGQIVGVGVGHRQGPPGNPAPTRDVGVGPKARPTKGVPNEPRVKYNDSFSAAVVDLVDKRNRRSVWDIATEPYREAHFATFPQALVEPCILAGSRPGDIVFDPFLGSGTTAEVAQRLGRHWLGAEINPAYVAMQARRTRQMGLLLPGATA